MVNIKLNNLCRQCFFMWYGPSNYCLPVILSVFSLNLTHKQAFDIFLIESKLSPHDQFFEIAREGYNPS